MMERRKLVIMCGLVVALLASLPGSSSALAQSLECWDLNESAEGCVEITNCSEEWEAVDEVCGEYLASFGPAFSHCQVDMSESFIRCNSDNDCPQPGAGNRNDYVHCEYFDPM
jgi:hypothetical protein